jgi:hypothetical protein
MGTRRFRKDVFSSSGMGLAWLYSSAGDQPFDMRFLRYTTAAACVSTLCFGDGHRRICTRQSYSAVLLALENVQQAVREARLLFGLDVCQCREAGALLVCTRTCFRSSSACCRMAALGSRVA